MLRQLIIKECRQLRWVIIIGIIMNLLTAIMAVVVYGYMRQIVEELPPDVIEILMQYGMGQQMMAIFAQYDVYLWSQWHGKNLVQLSSLLVIIVATIQFVQETSKKTMGFYLTRPITRAQGLMGKVLAGLLVLWGTFGIGTIFFLVVSVGFGYSVDGLRFLGAFGVSALWIAVFYGIAVWISIRSSEPVQSAVITAVVGLILSLPILLGSWRTFSIFYQMRAGNLFLQGQSPWGSVTVALLLAVLLGVANLRAFARREY